MWFFWFTAKKCSKWNLWVCVWRMVPFVSTFLQFHAFQLLFKKFFFQFKIVTFGTSKMCALWNRKSNEICIIQPNVPESVKCTENFVVFVFDQSNLKQNAYLKWIRALINWERNVNIDAELDEHTNTYTQSPHAIISCAFDSISWNGFLLCCMHMRLRCWRHLVIIRTYAFFPLSLALPVLERTDFYRYIQMTYFT